MPGLVGGWQGSLSFGRRRSLTVLLAIFSTTVPTSSSLGPHIAGFAVFPAEHHRIRR